MCGLWPHRQWVTSGPSPSHCDVALVLCGAHHALLCGCRSSRFCVVVVLAHHASWLHCPALSPLSLLPDSPPPTHTSHSASHHHSCSLTPAGLEDPHSLHGSCPTLKARDRAAAAAAIAAISVVAVAVAAQLLLLMVLLLLTCFQHWPLLHRRHNLTGCQVERHQGVALCVNFGSLSHF